MTQLLHKDKVDVHEHVPNLGCQCSPRLVSDIEAEKARNLGGYLKEWKGLAPDGWVISHKYWEGDGINHIDVFDCD